MLQKDTNSDLNHEFAVFVDAMSDIWCIFVVEEEVERLFNVSEIWLSRIRVGIFRY